MTTIIAGMTPIEFLTAVNGNFHSPETTILNTLQGDDFKTIFEGNYDAVKTIIPAIAEKDSLIIGCSASSFISTLNANFIKIKNVIENPTLDNNLMSIVNDGTKSPATSTNQYLNIFKAFKLGGTIQYSMWSYGGLAPSLYSGCPLPPTSFYNGTHDIAKWVRDAADAGIEYLCLSVLDGSQFALFDNPIRFPDYILNTVFGYKKYDIAVAGGDLNIVNKFYTSCALYGIEPIPYFCAYHTANLHKKIVNSITLDGTGGAFTAYTATQRQYLENYYAKVMQYFLTTWPSRYICLDMAGVVMVTNMQIYYDAIKAISPNCQVIALSLGDTPFTWYPYDIGSNEEYYSLTMQGTEGKTWADVLSSVRIHSGTNFYIPQEIVTNNHVQGEHYYYHLNPTFRTQQAIQDIYDIAKANSVPFTLNLAPDQTGLISSNQFDYFKNLIL